MFWRLCWNLRAICKDWVPVQLTASKFFFCKMISLPIKWTPTPKFLLCVSWFCFKLSETHSTKRRNGHAICKDLGQGFSTQQSNPNAKICAMCPDYLARGYQRLHVKPTNIHNKTTVNRQAKIVLRCTLQKTVTWHFQDEFSDRSYCCSFFWNIRMLQRI